MVHIILYAIVPIFVVMALGFFSGKAGAFSGENARTLNKVVLNYALPAALFISIIKANRHQAYNNLLCGAYGLLLPCVLCFQILL